MTYFSKFPKIPYDIKGDKNQKLVSDILRRVKLRAKVADVSNLFDKYDVPEGDTPETIALKHFGSTDYHWVILMTNDITDRYYGWPLDFSQFEKFIYDKYTNPDGIHHYEKIQDVRVEATGTADPIPERTVEIDYTTYRTIEEDFRKIVYVYEYEQEKNEAKRSINLISPTYITSIMEQFRGMFR